MNLALATQAVLEELTRMRSEGVDRIFMQDHTLQDLEDLLGPGSGIEKSYEPEVEVSQSNERVTASAPLTVAEPASTRVKAQVKKQQLHFLPPPVLKFRMVIRRKSGSGCVKRFWNVRPVMLNSIHRARWFLGRVIWMLNSFYVEKLPVRRRRWRARLLWVLRVNYW